MYFTARSLAIKEPICWGLCISEKYRCWVVAAEWGEVRVPTVYGEMEQLIKLALKRMVYKEVGRGRNAFIKTICL
jgi:hypothetical protein